MIPIHFNAHHSNILCSYALLAYALCSCYFKHLIKYALKTSIKKFTSNWSIKTFNQMEFARNETNTSMHGVKRKVETVDMSSLRNLNSFELNSQRFK